MIIVSIIHMKLKGREKYIWIEDVSGARAKEKRGMGKEEGEREIEGDRNMRERKRRR